MKLWEYKMVHAKDCLDRMSIDQIVDKLLVHVRQDDEAAFVEEINTHFLGGAWGFLFEVLDKAPGGYSHITFAADIRGLVWACLKKAIE